MEVEKCIHLAGDPGRTVGGSSLNAVKSEPRRASVSAWVQRSGKGQCPSWRQWGRKTPPILLGVPAFYFPLRLPKSGRAACPPQSINTNVNLIQKQPHTTHTHTHTHTECGLTKYLDSSLSHPSWHITLTITVSRGALIPPGHTATAPLNQSWDYGCLDATWFCICWSKWFILITRKT